MPQDAFAQARAWAEIDHELVRLKISAARTAFYEEVWQRCRDTSAVSSKGSLFQIQRIYTHGAREWAAVVFGIYSEVRQKQGNPRTSDFLRVVLTRGIIPEMEKMILDARCKIENLAQFGPSLNLTPWFEELAHVAESVRSEWRTRIEIEARELELEQAKRSLPSRPSVQPGNPARSAAMHSGIAEGALAADEFWRDLEARFRALHNEQSRGSSNDVLHALWSYIADPDNGTPWSLSGGPARICTQFEWLAQAAAVRLGHSGGPGAVFTWLDRLKAQSPHYKGGITGFWREPKVPKEVRTDSGLIELLCLASAEYCLKCETDEKTNTTLLEVAQRGPKPQPVPAPSVTHPLDARPDVVKRRAIIHQNRELSVRDLCARFDFESIPIPESWSAKYNVGNWGEAYRDNKCRPLVYKLMSTDKRKAQ